MPTFNLNRCVKSILILNTLVCLSGLITTKIGNRNVTLFSLLNPLEGSCHLQLQQSRLEHQHNKLDTPSAAGGGDDDHDDDGADDGDHDDDNDDG